MGENKACLLEVSRTEVLHSNSVYNWHMQKCFTTSSISIPCHFSALKMGT